MGGKHSSHGAAPKHTECNHGIGSQRMLLRASAHVLDDLMLLLPPPSYIAGVEVTKTQELEWKFKYCVHFLELLVAKAVKLNRLFNTFPCPTFHTVKINLNPVYFSIPCMLEHMTINLTVTVAVYRAVYCLPTWEAK